MLSLLTKNFTPAALAALLMALPLATGAAVSLSNSLPWKRAVPDKLPSCAPNVLKTYQPGRL